MEIDTKTIATTIDRFKAARKLRYDSDVTQEVEEMATWVYERTGDELIRAVGSPVNQTFAVIARHGYVYDGNIPSKTDRDLLARAGFIERGHGYQWLTWIGVFVAEKLGLLKD